jgi:hypothetical protein
MSKKGDEELKQDNEDLKQAITDEVNEEVIAEEIGQPKPINPRDEAMQRIVQEARDDRAHERGEEIEEEIAEEEIAEEEIAEEEIAEEIIVDNNDEKEDTVKETKVEPTSITLKVNGVDVEMSIDEAKAKLQQNVHAQNQMREAAELKKQAQAILDQSAKHSTQSDDSTTQTVDDEALKKAFTAVYDGDIDEATQILSTALRSATRSSESTEAILSTEDVSAIVESTVQKAADQQALKDAFRRFESNDEFQVLRKDPYLMNRVDTATVELQNDAEFMATNPTYDDFFNEAGKRTLDWVKGFAPQPSADTEIKTETSTRVARKQSLSAQPVKRTVRRGPAPSAAPAKTTDDVIRAMKQQRGQSH